MTPAEPKVASVSVERHSECKKFCAVVLQGFRTVFLDNIDNAVLALYAYLKQPLCKHAKEVCTELPNMRQACTGGWFTYSFLVAVFFFLSG